LEIQITWNPSSDSGSGVAGYKIPENGETSSGNYDENGVFVPTAPIPGTIRNTYIPTWAYGSDRCYSVIAYDLANNASAPSDYSCVAIPPNYSIDVPSDLSADTNSYPNITFFWTEGEFIHPDLHSSLVFDLYKQGSLTPVTISGGTNSYSDPLTGRRYANINDTSGFWGNEPCFTVVTRAVNPTTGASIVTSPSSSYCATYTPPPPAPFVSVPSNLSHTVAGNGRVTLYWTNSVSTYPASSIVLYELSTYKDGVYAFLGDDSNGTPSASFHPNAWGNPNPPQFCWAIRARDSGNNLSAMSAPSCFAYP
jgi:hypothetical protein